MSSLTPIPLTPLVVEVNSPEYAALANWPFQDPFVARLLHDDIPQRAQFGSCRVWIYQDPEGLTVGLGTLDLCDECSEFTGGLVHPYIPLLAARPNLPPRGHGTTILRHLVDEAALWALEKGCAPVLFLDVYTSSTKAMGLYTKNGFQVMSTQPIPDQLENGKTYIVMARRIETVK